MRLVYLDASALVKLVVTEAESEALEQYLDGGEHVASSRLAGVELLRVLLRVHAGPAAVQRAHTVIASTARVSVTENVLLLAAGLEPANLRTLDAIHVATALAIHATDLVTYDRRMAEAASRHDIAVRSPR